MMLMPSVKTLKVAMSATAKVDSLGMASIAQVLICGYGI